MQQRSLLVVANRHCHDPGAHVLQRLSCLRITSAWQFEYRLQAPSEIPAADLLQQQGYMSVPHTGLGSSWRRCSFYHAEVSGSKSVPSR